MAANKLVQRPLYAFDLPEELLSSLQYKAGTVDERPQQEVDVKSSSDSVDRQPSSATACNTCNLTFTSVQDQRAHARSDLHGYNLKQKLHGRPPITEIEFENLVDQLDESISGSDSEESTDDEDIENKQKPDTLTTLLKKQAQLHDGDAEDAPVKAKRKGAGNAPIFWFKSGLLPANTSLGIYRSIFTTDEQEEEAHLVESLRSKQISKASKPAPVQDEDDDAGGVPLPGAVSQATIKAGGPHYFLCMIGGGHFAAMLVSLTPKIGKKSGVEDRTATVLAHKTFHRYTTRRKQGGSQSANDNAKGNAHSAGAGIRRYNETALELDVRTLLSDWKPWIESADLLFIRATGTTNRKTLFGPYDGAVLSQRDDRLRGFPFNTRRATQAELMRAFIELTRVKVSTIDEAALAQRAAEEEAKKQQDAQKAAAKSMPTKVPKPSKEDEEATLHTTQIQALIKRSRAPALVSYLQSNGISADFKLFPSERHHHAPTPLHLASASNATACVTALLVKLNADPTIPNGDGRTAFELAGERATRDAFSLARGKLGESRWDWTTAGVPAAITQEEADFRTAREKDEAAAAEKAEKARREADVQKLRQEDEQRHNASKEKKFGIGKTLAAMPMTAEQRRAQDAKGMTDEMRLRLERERRARAAEERMRRLQNGS